MDPDVLYGQIKIALLLMSEARDDDEYTSGASDLWSAVVSLDDWMSKGGFPPAPWREPTRMTTL